MSVILHHIAIFDLLEWYLKKVGQSSFGAAQHHEESGIETRRYSWFCSITQSFDIKKGGHSKLQKLCITAFNELS